MSHRAPLYWGKATIHHPAPLRNFCFAKRNGGHRGKISVLECGIKHRILPRLGLSVRKNVRAGDIGNIIDILLDIFQTWFSLFLGCPTICDGHGLDRVAKQMQRPNRKRCPPNYSFFGNFLFSTPLPGALVCK